MAFTGEVAGKQENAVYLHGQGLLKGKRDQEKLPINGTTYNARVMDWHRLVHGRNHSGAGETLNHHQDLRHRAIRRYGSEGWNLPPLNPRSILPALADHLNKAGSSGYGRGQGKLITDG
jgi:hypothetical protein